MIEIIQEKKLKTYKRHEVPANLVKEVLDGKPYFYPGYRDVLSGKKNVEDIMGCSEMQFLVISAIMAYLIKNLPENQFVISSNEVGLHLDKKNNLASDLVIFDRSTILAGKAKSKYTATVPLAIFEVEIFDEHNIPSEPYTTTPTITKTERLLKWGVQEVIWLYPQARKLTRAIQGEDSWITMPWTDSFLLLNQYKLSIGQIVGDYGILLD